MQISRSHHYSDVIRDALYSDLELGAGNFLFKVLIHGADGETELFQLEQPFIDPSGVAYSSLTLGELYHLVREIAGWYREQGINAGHTVCTYTSEGISQFLHFLALTSLHAIPVPINCQMSPDIAVLYHEKYQFDFFVYDQHLKTAALEQLAVGKAGFLSCIEMQSPHQTFDPPDWPASFSDDEVVMICHSSGTTGIPKAVLFTHGQFFFGKRERLLNFLEIYHEKMLSALPHSHSAGISYLMTAVLLGIPTLILSNLTGASVAAHIQAFRPSIMVAFPQTYASLADLGLTENAFPTLRRFYNTGDAAHESHIRSLVNAAPAAHFYDGFGASELGMALFSKVSTRDQVASGRCVGHPVAFASLKIIDDHNQDLPPQAIGYVALKSPTITPGYYKNDCLTSLCRTIDGYWLTGDLGYTDEHGNLYHVDRAVDAIRTPSGMAYSLLLEEAVLQAGEIHDVTIVGVTQTPRCTQFVVAFINETPQRSQDTSAKVLATLANSMQGTLGINHTICVASWSDSYTPPVGATGKVLKRVVRDSFWSQYQAYLAGDRSVFSNIVWANKLLIFAEIECLQFC